MMAMVTRVNDESDDPNITTNTDIDGDGDPDDPTITTLPDVKELSLKSLTVSHKRWRIKRLLRD